MKAMFIFLKELLAPPSFSDAAKTRKATLLNSVLLTALLAVILTTLITPFAISNYLLFELILLLEITLLVGMLYLLRRGAVQFASVAVLVGLGIIFVGVALFSGGVQTIAFSTLNTVILAAGLLLGSRASFRFAGISSLIGLGLLLTEVNHLLPNILIENTSVLEWVGLSLNFVVSATILSLSADMMQKALHSAEQSAQTLRESEVQLNLVFNSTSDAQILFRVESNNRFVFQTLNQAFKDGLQSVFSSLPPTIYDEFIGKERGELMRQYNIPPDMIGIEMPLYRTVVEEGKSFQRELQIPTPNGMLALDILLSPVLDPNGKCTHVLWNARNITARKQSEKALLQQNIRMQALHHLALEFFTPRDEEDLYQIILQHANQLLFADFSALHQPGPEGTMRMRKMINQGTGSGNVPPFEFARGEADWVWRVYDQQQPIALENYFISTGQLIHGVQVHPLLSIPMLMSGTCVGVLVIGRTSPHQAFTTDDLQMGGLLAQLATAALESAQLFRKTQLHARNEAQLNTITRTVIEATNSLNMFQSLCGQLVELFNSDSAYLTRWDETRQQPVPMVASGALQDEYPSISVLSNEKSMTASLMQAEHTLVVEDTFHSPYISPRIAAQFPTRSILGLPLIAGGQKLGAAIISYHHPHKFHAEEINLAEKAAQQIALALARFQINEALRNSEANLREAQHLAHLGNYEYDVQTKALFWSEEVYRIFEMSSETPVTLEAYEQLVSQPHFDQMIGSLQDLIQSHMPVEFEHEITLPGGAPKQLYAKIRPVLDEAENIIRVFGIVQDITERKRAEDTLREREAQLAIIFNNVSDRQVLFRIEALDQFVAQTANRAFILALRDEFPECSLDNLIGKPIEQGFLALGLPPEFLKKEVHLARMAIADLKPTNFEVEIPTRKGLTTLFLSLIPIVDGTGRCTHLLWNGQDVTERKRAEAKLLASLTEKEVLLKEIHHRVKNNLQVISSLLYLQAQKIKDERFQDIFRESQNRVSAMALVHEQLYQSNNFAEVNFGAYARTLAETLFETYGVHETQIELVVNTDGATLDIHTAIPCGLLVSEMISNALKYAFPNGRQGTITLTFREEGKLCQLIVSDDGIGMPNADQIRPGSLGLQLIDRLAAQIGASVKRTGPPGTTYHLARMKWPV